MGKVAIVTGASGGLGSGLVVELARSSVNVGGCFFGDHPDLVRQFKRVGNISVHYLDVRDFERVRKAFVNISDKFGPVDYLVTCHGIAHNDKIENMDWSKWSDVLATNLTGNFNCIKAALGVMKNPSQILVISSITWETGLYGASNYAASKSGLVGLVRSAALELEGKGVAVNLFASGYFDAGMGKSLSDSVKRKVLSERGEFGDPREFARKVKNILFNVTATGRIFV